MALPGVRACVRACVHARDRRRSTGRARARVCQLAVSMSGFVSTLRAHPKALSHGILACLQRAHGVRDGWEKCCRKPRLLPPSTRARKAAGQGGVCLRVRVCVYSHLARARPRAHACIAPPTRPRTRARANAHARTHTYRFLVFDKKGKLVAKHQEQKKQIYPKPGWCVCPCLRAWQCAETQSHFEHSVCVCMCVTHDPNEIIANVYK
jgi:hypothetical protein